MASPYLDCFVAFAPRNDGATYGSFVILRWPRLRPSKDAAEAYGLPSFEARRHGEVPASSFEARFARTSG